jgi:hypothetical protein
LPLPHSHTERNEPGELSLLTSRRLCDLRMKAVAELVGRVKPGDKTLFLVDETEGEQTLPLFTHSAKYVVLDADTLNMKKTIKKQSVSSILEECRFQVTFAMKYGKILVLRFGLSMTDFKFTFCDEHCSDLEPLQKHHHHQKAAYLPRGFMLRSGADLTTESSVRAMYRRDDIVEMLMDMEEEEAADLRNVVPVCHPDFRIVMTTSMPFNKLDDFHFHNKYGLPAARGEFDIRVVTADGKVVEP